MGGGRKAEEGFNLSLFTRPPFSPSVIFHFFYFLRMSEILLMFLLLDRLRFIFSTSPLLIELATKGRNRRFAMVSFCNPHCMQNKSGHAMVPCWDFHPHVLFLNSGLRT